MADFPSGDPKLFTQANGDSPIGLWDPSRATANFEGTVGFVGGSMPEDGKQPWDTFAPVTSAQGFWSLPTYAEKPNT